MTTNQNESKKDYLNVENVHFTTDGNKKVRMFVDYKTNITEEYVLNASIFEGPSSTSDSESAKRRLHTWRRMG